MALAGALALLVGGVASAQETPASTEQATLPSAGEASGATVEDPPEARVRWGPLACVAEGTLEARVRALLPRRRTIPDAFTAEARIAQDGDHFRLTIDLPGGVQREIASERCDALVDAAALVVAIAIDPAALHAPAIEEPGPSDDDPSEAAPSQRRHLAVALASPRGAPDARSPSPEPVAPRDEASPWRFGGGAYAGIGIGTLPSPIPGPVFEGMAAYDAAVLRIGVGYFPGSAARFDDFRGATLDLIHTRVSLCAHLSLPPVSGELCADTELDDIRASGYGLDNPRTSETLFAAVGPTARVRVTLVGPLGLTAALGAVFAIDPPTFVIDGVGAVFTPELAAFRALLGLDLVFR